MAGEVLIDALPYIDLGYDEPGVKQLVIKILNFELKSSYLISNLSLKNRRCHWSRKNANAISQQKTI